MTFATTDLCDAHEDQLADGRLRVLPPVFRDFGGRLKFAGIIETLRVFEDNTLVRAALETAGAGRVLVVDGGASLRCALVGGNLGKLAERNGWAGIVVNGCVRDAVELAGCQVGIRALAAMPRKSRKGGAGERSVQIDVQGQRVLPGQWCYADEDGILIADQALG
ncbi:MAG TPA: ribonuclease E activity regulator RraA [Burkholderiaceae bacterium]|nr:ribonuclease E activity regulator RraA [Burkholderiaceae bacterium]